MTLHRCGIGLFLVLLAAPVSAGPLPTYLPRYRVEIDLDVAGHQAKVSMWATWTNPARTPTNQLVFNAHSRYVVPDDQIGFTAKMLEILRMVPSEAMGARLPPLDVETIALVSPQGAAQNLTFRYEGDTKTSLVVNLPFAVGEGQSVTVRLDMLMTLPQKQGRWGQWRGVTYLSNWLPVFAFYGDQAPRGNAMTVQAARPEPRVVRGKQETLPPPIQEKPKGASWQPTPFIPWHQPFFNESCIYDVRLTLPTDQELATSGTIVRTVNLGNGKKTVEIKAHGVREFTFLCSACYRVYEGTVNAGPGGAPVRVHILALPQHDHYARQILRISIEALEVYSKWFGPYPWTDFTIAEAFFGWNGNECSTLVMIDERVFGMPHLACNYVEYLVSHEISHQWWYNLVGTNGFCETWMDEAMANYFTHRMLNRKLGKNNKLMVYPAWLEWLPNIHREDYRSSGMYSTFAKGESTPVCQEMTQFGHLANLFNLCYDKGGRLVGMIEDRLGEAAFMDFIRCVVKKYRYRILRVADFRRELELYTGYSWQEFFHNWLYSKGISDWSIDKVTVQRAPKFKDDPCPCMKLKRQILLVRCACPEQDPIPPGGSRITVWVHQKADYNEPTQLGFALPNCDGYPIRIPILPGGKSYRIEEPPARIEVLDPDKNGGMRLKVEVVLPATPTQIAIDPDQVLVDAEPDNNYWHTPIRWRFTPLYTFLEETDLTNAYDRLNVIFGPWLYRAPYDDAWYTRSTLAGARLGLYRTQQFNAGLYAGYRTDYRDVVTGIDAMWDHWPYGHMQVGFNVEKRLADSYAGADDQAFRGVVWARHIFQYGSSLYLPPMHFLEGFVQYQDNFLPEPTESAVGAERYRSTSTTGLHYRLNYLTPYWDPEGGFQVDLWSEAGTAALDKITALGKLSGQVTVVKGLPDLSHNLPDSQVMQNVARPVLEWLGDTRLAMRAYGATAVPAQGEFFSMGGSSLFRGYDLAQRQGSTAWVGSLEWRVPVKKGLTIDALDHVMGLRHAYMALFYDIGDVMANGRSIGPVAHGVGAGIRLDVAWFSFVERTTIRVDVAKTINDDTGVQVWFGVMHPF